MSNAFARVGLDVTRSRTEVAMTLVRVGLGEDPAHKYLAWDKRLMRALLADLVTSRPMPPNEIDAMVLVAEMRLHAVHRKALEKRSVLLRWIYSRSSQLTPMKAVIEPAPRQEIPESIIGQSLKAIARFDFDRLAALPEEPSDETARIVTKHGFESIVTDRFGPDPDRDQVKALSERVSRLARSPSVTAEQVESVILSHVGLEQLSTESADRAFEIMLLVLTRLVDDLGLYEHELNLLLLGAEAAAEASGCELTPLPMTG